MLDAGFLLPALYIRHIADELRSRGVDLARWLELAGLSERALADPELPIDWPAFRQLVLGSQALSREPALGLFVGERLEAPTHGMLGYAVMAASTLRQALEVFERFARLRTSILAIGVELRPREVRVVFTEGVPLEELERPVLDAVALSVANVLAAISMGTCRVRQVAFRYPRPPYAALARELFGCEVRYGQEWTGLVLPAHLLDEPLKLADPAAFQEAARICQRELDKLTTSETMATRVRRLLLEKQQGFPSLQVAARRFHLTPRTLHRRLVAEGTSFRALLEEVRHTLALEHVKSGRFSIEEIAYRLGYSDLANFRRAFKRWHAMPPSAYRASLSAARPRARAPRARRGGPRARRPRTCALLEVRRCALAVGPRTRAESRWNVG